MPALPPPAMTPPGIGGMTAPTVLYIELAGEDQQRRRSQYEAMKLHFGTGGTFRYENNTLVESTNNVFSINRQAAQPCRAQLLPGMMQDIKEFLVPQVKDIAKVLGASRPTVYAWLQGSSAPSEANYARIETVHAWALKAKGLLADCDEKLVSNALIASPLVALLSTDTAPSLINRHVLMVASEVKAAQASKAAPAEDTLDLFAIAKGMGRTLAPDATSRAYIDAITGKGYGPEVDDE